MAPFEDQHKQKLAVLNHIILVDPYRLAPELLTRLFLRQEKNCSRNRGYQKRA